VSEGTGYGSLNPVSGNDLTIADLYGEFEDRLRRYAVSLARDADRAEDLVQETYIRAMAHLPLLSQLKPYQRRAWLYRVLKNRFLDEQRAARREQALLEQLAQDVQMVGAPAWASSLAWFDEVPEQYREVLHKRHLLGMTSEEIGRELGVPAATVRSRLYLARKWLRAHRAEFEFL
jgi:RNA polymerase sigma-70 factor (ECF subfamily)